MTYQEEQLDRAYRKAKAVLRLSDWTGNQILNGRGYNHPAWSRVRCKKDRLAFSVACTLAHFGAASGWKKGTSQ